MIKSTAVSGRYVLFVDEEDAQLVRLWRQLAEEERERNPWLIFALVDAAASPELVERFSVESIPAALLFRDRKACCHFSFIKHRGAGVQNEYSLLPCYCSSCQVFGW